jgi:hypothetical protein
MSGAEAVDPLANNRSSSAAEALPTARLSTRSVYRPASNFSPRNLRIEVWSRISSHSEAVRTNGDTTIPGTLTPSVLNASLYKACDGGAVTIAGGRT